MLRKDQLSNVSFGGAWSERIAGDEELKKAMALIEKRIEETFEEDLREDSLLLEAVERVTGPNPKREELRAAFGRALSVAEGVARFQELRRLARLMRGWLGARIA